MSSMHEEKENMTHSSEILRSTTRTGNSKFWQAHLEYKVAPRGQVTSNEVQLYTTYWQVNKDGVESKKTSSVPTKITPKNVGKANETNVWDQGVAELESLIQKQRDKGYRLEGEAEAEVPLPMLAQKYSERKHTLTWPVYVQPKYDGQRMLCDGTRGWTRGNKEVIPDVIAHIIAEFENIPGLKGKVIDGELLLPGNVPLQDTMKAVKKYRAGVSDTLQYVVYDYIDTTKGFKERMYYLAAALTSANVGLNRLQHILLAPTSIASSEIEVLESHAMYVADGYEGTMVRSSSGGYEVGQRSNTLQKYKDFVDDEFLIVDVLEGVGSHEGLAVFVCRAGDVTFKCLHRGTHEFRKGLWESRDSLKGKWLTVKYQTLSNDGVPIFPIGIDIRDEVGV